MLEKVREEYRELIKAAIFCEFNQTILAKYLGTTQSKISNIKTYILKESGIIKENGEKDEEKLKEIRTDYLNKIANGLFEKIQYKDQTDYIKSLNNSIMSLEEENTNLRKMLAERAPEEKNETFDDFLNIKIEDNFIESEKANELKKDLEKAKIKIESYRDSIRLLGGGNL